LLYHVGVTKLFLKRGFYGNTLLSSGRRCPDWHTRRATDTTTCVECGIINFTPRKCGRICGTSPGKAGAPHWAWQNYTQKEHIMTFTVPDKGFTHAGRFHADDVFAAALLRLCNPNIRIQRGFSVPEGYDGIVF